MLVYRHSVLCQILATFTIVSFCHLIFLIKFNIWYCISFNTEVELWLQYYLSTLQESVCGFALHGHGSAEKQYKSVSANITIKLAGFLEKLFCHHKNQTIIWAVWWEKPNMKNSSHENFESYEFLFLLFSQYDKILLLKIFISYVLII